MALNETDLNSAIKRFAATISQQLIGLVLHRPYANAVHTNCISNALVVFEKYGGKVRFGWYFLFRTSLKYGDYLIATHHAVWHNPTDRKLVDVTPFHPEEKHRPISFGGDLIFLVDDKAQPYETGKYVIPLPSRFYAIKDDPGIQEYVASLQHEEYELYNRDYGSSFP